MSLWDAVKHGWNVNYALQVEGIKTLFVETPTGLAFSGGAPFADHTVEDASLVIDDSSKVGSEVDRYRGLGVGLNFSFKLLDSTITKALFTAPSLISFLDENVSAADTSIKVDSVAGWPASGEFYLGKELVSYSSIVGSDFQVSSRGVAGKAYQHRMISSGNQVTDRPRWMKGRQVTLWAIAMDPAGQTPGANYATAANLQQVWKGQIVDGPGREAGLFTFEAVSMDRLLDVPLFGGGSGSVISTEAHHQVDTSWLFGGVFSATSGAGSTLWSHHITCQPFASLMPGQFYTGAELRKALIDAFSAEVTAMGVAADITGLAIVPNYVNVTYSNTYPLKSYTVKLIVPYVAGLAWPGKVEVYGASWSPSQVVTCVHDFWSSTPSAGQPVAYSLGYVTNDDPSEPIADYGTIPNGPTGLGISGLVVELEEGSDASIPSTGTLVISNGDLKGKLGYSYHGTSGGAHYFGGLQPQGPGALQFTPGDVVGASVSVLFNATGSLYEIATKTIASSGTAGLRHATFDAYQLGSGYGIDQADINTSGLEKLKAVGLQLSANMAGTSFADVLGGLLGLSRHAIVSRPSGETYGDIRLTAVSTGLGGSDYKVIIADSDVLALRGQPVEMLKPAPAPNLITVIQAPDGQEEESKIIYSDAPSIMALGATDQEWTVPALNRQELMLMSMPWATSYLAEDRTVFALKLIVPPWIDAQVGDQVKLNNLSHPALWNFVTGSHGYNGQGRVLGRVMDLRTLTVELTVMVAGSVAGLNLCPSMTVLAYDSATVPTSITVAGKHFDHLSQALVGNSRVELLHYFPGSAESDSEYVTYNAVTMVGANAVLSILIESVAALTSLSHLTFPRSADANLVPFQAGFAHCDSGGHWS